MPFLSARVSRLLGRLRRAPRTLAALRDEKTSVARYLAEYSTYMVPGWYRINGPVVHRLCSPMPTSLRETNRGTYDRHLGFWDRLPSIVKAYLLPPLLVQRPTARNEVRFRGTTLLVAEHAAIKLFAVADSEVLTILQDPDVLARLELGYSALAPYLSLTRITVDHVNFTVREPLIDGRAFHRTIPTQRDQAYRSLIGGLTELTMNASKRPLGGGVAKYMVQCIIDNVRSYDFASVLLAQQADVEALLAISPLTPSHGDLHGNNVLVDRTGPKIIDLDNFGWRPFFYDALFLPLVRTPQSPPAGTPIFNDVLGGRFDSELDTLCRAARVKQFSSDKLAYFLAAVVFRLHEGVVAQGWSSTKVNHYLATTLPSHRLLDRPTTRVG